MEQILQTRVYCVYFSNHTTVYFKEDSFGYITPTASHETTVDLPPSPSLLKLMKSHLQREKKIRQKCGANLSTLDHLDFSGLDLKRLPPHILLECKQARTLDLRGNDLYFLPIQLQHLPLTCLNISGNKRLQSNIPEWLGAMPGLTLIADDIGLDFIPKGFTQDRVVSNDLPEGVLFEVASMDENDCSPLSLSLSPPSCYLSFSF